VCQADPAKIKCSLRKQVLRELLLSDDVGAARHAAGALEEDFFNGTKACFNSSMPPPNGMNFPNCASAEGPRSMLVFCSEMISSYPVISCGDLQTASLEGGYG